MQACFTFPCECSIYTKVPRAVLHQQHTYACTPHTQTHRQTHAHTHRHTLVMILTSYFSQLSDTFTCPGLSPTTTTYTCTHSRVNLTHLWWWLGGGGGQVGGLTHIMPIFPPIMLCSSAPSLSYYSFPVATYYVLLLSHIA